MARMDRQTDTGVRAITMSLPVGPCPSLLLLREGQAPVLSRWRFILGDVRLLFSSSWLEGSCPSPLAASPARCKPKPSNPGPAASNSSVALSVGPGTA